MAIIRSGNAIHDQACLQFEGQRQAAVSDAEALASNYWRPDLEVITPAGPAVRMAEIQFLRRCLASAIANGVSPSVFLTGLRELNSGPA